METIIMSPVVPEPSGMLVGSISYIRDCTDYTKLRENNTGLQRQQEEHDDVRPENPGLSTPPNVRGTGQVFPYKFVPSNKTMTPMEVFPIRRVHNRIARWVHMWDRSKVLIMADGACLNNGQLNPMAGWAFFHGEKFNGEPLAVSGEPLVVSGRLEEKGPWGDDGAQTSNRAELRAVIAALRFRNWRDDGFRTVVIAVDSSYVVDGATQWARSWVRNGWKTSRMSGRSSDVKNKDLWEILLGEFERARDNNLGIQLWKIPREWNTLADEGAKRGAAQGDAPERWSDTRDQAL